MKTEIVSKPADQYGPEQHDVRVVKAGNGFRRGATWAFETYGQAEAYARAIEA